MVVSSSVRPSSYATNAAPVRSCSATTPASSTKNARTSSPASTSGVTTDLNRGTEQYQMLTHHRVRLGHHLDPAVVTVEIMRMLDGESWPREQRMA